jgi:opacity protein-like surface antigen
MNVRRRTAMQKLFLVALIVGVGVCTPVILAQEPAKAGISPNLRLNVPDTSKRDVNFNPRAAAGVAGGPAQCPPRCPNDDYNSVEIYGGYSLLLLDGFATDVVFADFLEERLHFHGIDLSATFNFSRYVGAQVDFSTHKRSEDLVDFGLVGDADANIQNFLFGIQVKNNSENGSRFRPFGHFLAGVSRQKLEIESPLLIPIIGVDEFSLRRSSFALAMGGGIDIRITENFSIRPVKLDYLPVFIDDFESVGVVFDGRTQKNFRAGAGLVFHF